jgi:hypothetical protein
MGVGAVALSNVSFLFFVLMTLHWRDDLRMRNNHPAQIPMPLQLHRISCDACNSSDHILKLDATSIFVLMFHWEEQIQFRHARERFLSS